MTFAQTFVVLVLVFPLALVFVGRLREDVAALLMATLLGLAQALGMGVLGPPHTPADAELALTGFGTPEVLTLIALFIITYALDKYGVTRGLATRILAIGGRSERRLIILFAGTAALLSLFMNTLAAGALLLPSALEACRRTGVKPSKLLIPIAYGTMLGGAATYLTTANVIISGLLPLAEPPQEPLGFFAFTPTGGFNAIAGLIFLAIAGKRLLPDREPPALPITPSGSELTETYRLQERLWEVLVPRDSAFVGKSITETRVGEELGMTILGIRRGQRVIPTYGEFGTIQPEDTLLIVGNEKRVHQLQDEGMPVAAPEKARPMTGNSTVLAEFLVPPRSGAEGKTLRELAFRARYGFTVVALWRDNRSYRTDLGKFELRPGDSLLLVGPADKAKGLKDQNDFVVLATAAGGNGVHRRRMMMTMGIGIAALVAVFAGVPVELAMIAGATLLLLTGLLTPEEAYGAIKWRAIFLIGGTIAVSVAMVQTGLAQKLGESLVHLSEPLGSMGLVVATYLISALLTQVMGGQISPLVVGPITISAAIHLGVNAQAIAVVTAIAGSVSFITPLSHPVNILMIAPANYKFSDFVKSGWILTIVCFVALLIAVPLFWTL